MKLYIKHWRKIRKLTLHDLSRLTAISISYLDEIENNKANITLDKLETISSALEVCPKLLIQCGRSMNCDLCTYQMIR